MKNLKELARKFKSNIETNMSLLPINSGSNKHQIPISSEWSEEQKLDNQRVNNFNQFTSEVPDEILMFILDVHLREVFNEEVQIDEYLYCAELFARQAKGKDEIIAIKNLVPKASLLNDQEIEYCKANAPNFLNLLSFEKL